MTFEMLQWSMLQRCKWTSEPCWCEGVRTTGERGGGGRRSGSRQGLILKSEGYRMEIMSEEAGGKAVSDKQNEAKKGAGNKTVGNKTASNLSGGEPEPLNRLMDRIVYKHEYQMCRNIKMRMEEKWVQQDREGRWGKEFKTEGRWGEGNQILRISSTYSRHLVEPEGGAGFGICIH